MAKAKTKELTVEDKLRALYDLQLIDKRVDEIRNLRGELPLEVEDLEDEITGLETRVANLNNDVADLEKEISDRKLQMRESLEKITKYEEQQKNVRNNREFDAISKEVEFQQLEIQLAEKRTKEFEAKIANKNEVIAQSDERLAERKKHLEFKRKELDGIMAETQKEEELLLKKSEELRTDVEERLIKAYDRIRNSTRNGLAVVSIERGASAGSFFVIPPQRQLEIAQRKKIITDEHSGRILVDPKLAEQEEEKMTKMINDWLK
jgi:predicted  nucleic acid-binding Zn-ribbon protein